MLRVEAALATAAARVGLVDEAAARAVAEVCRTDRFDLADLGTDVGTGLAEDLIEELATGEATQATPVIALVRRLRELVPAAARDAVHVAATSQDVLDTAAVLVTRDALAAVLDDAAAVADQLAGLADRHRGTLQIGRTLGQHAEPTSFGAACAVRLVAVDEARDRLDALRRTRLAVQLGGPVGTLAGAGSHADALVAALADELGLAVPVLPWQPTRSRMVEPAVAAAVLAGELAGVAQDVVLLAGSDIGEVAVAAPGGSSSMPHKRNPARPVLALGCAHRIPGLVAGLLAGMPQELQRATGRWQAEPGTLTQLYRLVGGVAAHTRAGLDGLTVHADRMRATVEEAVRGTDRGAPVDAALQSAGRLVDRALAAHDAVERTIRERATTAAADPQGGSA
jgi:3-carboxy-cis,cis-muconate cycloisomerase